MHKYKLILSYDGTHYSGWQIQPNGYSIQQVIQESLTTILRTPKHVTGSGRTDAGVHALGQVAHFSHDQLLDTDKLQLSLNGLLPEDVRILTIGPVETNFHARFHAVGKIYRYHLHLDPIMSPFKQGYCYHVRHPVDLYLLQQGIECFVGTRDFSSFSNQASKGSAGRNPVRTIKRIDIVKEPGGIYLEFEGNGFLYKMVRNISGTLLDLCKGKITLEELPLLFAAKDRKQTGRALPPFGLFLAEVHYRSNQNPAGGLFSNDEKCAMPFKSISAS
jgi:tRNA pseudouridine38-40 synthase